jgi:glycolate oxidase FAD binding subunit
MDASVSPKVLHGTLEADVRGIAGAKYLRPAVATDAICGVQPSLVVEPGTEQELAKILKLANAAGVAVIPRGGGTKLEWGNRPARAEMILSTARLDRVLEHAWADMTVTVEAGCTVGKLQETVAKRGQRLAIDPLWPARATIGGILSTNDSGVLRLRFGSLRDLIIGVTIVLPDGTVASSGGKVVKNVAGYDLPKLVTGALGTLGVITRAIFRLHPLPKETRAISWSAPDAGEAQRIVLAIQNSKLAHSALQVRFGDGKQPQVDVLFEGIEAGLAAQTDQVGTMMQPLTPREAEREVWNAQQEVYRTGRGGRGFVVAKFSTLPSRIADTLASIRGLCPEGVGYAGVVQATGIGCLRLEGKTEVISDIARALRGALGKGDGSFVVRHRPAELADFDAWGAAGDALELMRAVKQQFDPGRILNPGRFVGGI